MTPLETLAAARLSPVGPYVPARVDWLREWRGPVMVAESDLVWTYCGRRRGLHFVAAPTFDHHDVVGDDDILRVENIRLDLRRPEVRDLLVRHGCPAWARDVPAAVWAWANGVVPTAVLRAWDDTWAPRADRWSAAPIQGACICTVTPPYGDLDSDRPGWRFSLRGNAQNGPQNGTETGDLGRACADLAALRERCLLEEVDGWYVPHPNGGVGWWPKNLETP